MNKRNDFSEEEKEFLRLLEQGMNTSEISKYLSLSYHDTAEMVSRIRKKLNVNKSSSLEKSAK
jgi:DNA-binding CsgD family transcriptional regulator